VTGGKRFSPYRLWPSVVLQGGLRSRREANAWQGYGSNTANPPDANSRQKGGSDIAASRWMRGARSDDRRVMMGGDQFRIQDPPNILMFINAAEGFKLWKNGFCVICWSGNGLGGGFGCGY